MIAEKFVEIFNWYEYDLDEVHKLYEKNKVGELSTLKCGKCFVQNCKLQDHIQLNLIVIHLGVLCVKFTLKQCSDVVL